MPLRLALIACTLFVPLIAAAQPALDTDRLMSDVRFLSSDALQGRGVGTEGGRLARWRVEERFREVGLMPLSEEEYARRFAYRVDGTRDSVRAVNVVGYVQGTELPDSFIVVTAHYDHLGVRQGQVYNGADDNASGTAGLLALAEHFAANPPRHSMIFAALDAEEVGLKGAFVLVEELLAIGRRPQLNVNMDMIGGNERGELFAAGTRHSPFLRPLIESVPGVEGVRLRFGHDAPGPNPGDDWTFASDQGPFYAEGIPFVYFGVEDHPDYHQPTDDFARIDPAFFGGAVTLIARVLAALDAGL